MRAWGGGNSAMPIHRCRKRIALSACGPVGAVTQSFGSHRFPSLTDGSMAYGPGLGVVLEPSWNMPVVQHGALGGLSEGFHYSTLFASVGVNGGTLALNNIQNTVNLMG